MARYRVPMEFHAEDDDDARSMVETQTAHEHDEHNGIFRPVPDELTREDTYWRRVSPPEEVR